MASAGIARGESTEAVLKELGAIQRNYSNLVPLDLQDPVMVRALLEYVVANHTHKSSYDFETQRHLCFDSSVIFFDSFRIKFPTLVAAVPGMYDHVFLLVPAAKPEDNILIDCSWRQFFAPYKDRNPDLYAALPQVLIKKQGQVRDFIDVMARGFGLVHSEVAEIKKYYSEISSVSRAAQGAHADMERLTKHWHQAYGNGASAQSMIGGLHAHIQASAAVDVSRMAAAGSSDVSVAAGVPSYRGSFEAMARGDLVSEAAAGERVESTASARTDGAAPPEYERPHL